ncbi:Transposon related HTH domain protein, partial [Dysosmobacter welbionis]
RVDAQIVGNGGQDDVAVLEALGNQVGHMGVGHVVQGHVGDAPFAELGGQRLGGCLGVAVHGGVDNQHALDFRLIAAPFVVLVDEVAQILPPHGTMKGADIPDLVQDAAGLAQQQLDVGAILAHDVGEVPAGLVDPVPVEV